MSAKSLTARTAFAAVCLNIMYANSVSAFQEQPGAGSVTVQQPVFGVAVDADGVLKVQASADPSGKLRAQHIAAAKQKIPQDVISQSKLRKVSLIKLERAIRECLDAGKVPDQPMQFLAGLQRLRYVFFYPESNDIVIAGPAEGWIPDAAGRIVGITSGQPVLRLDDLLVALRAYPPVGPALAWFGCSIGPTPSAIQRLREFQRTIPRRVRQSQRTQVATLIEKGLRENLGMTPITVIGISPKTHFAQVLVEADYRMKRIGIGLEPTPIKMPTYLSSVRTVRRGSWMRWWFVPEYERVSITDDGLAMELVGERVKLLGENMVPLSNGKLIDKAGTKPPRASQMYTTAFTRNYPQIAARSRVFAEMRNLIDLSVAAVHLRMQDFYRRAGWSPTIFLDEESLHTETLPTLTAVPGAVNVVWKGNRLVAPSGGVAIQPELAFERERLIEDDGGKLDERRRRMTIPAERWWWD